MRTISLTLVILSSALMSCSSNQSKNNDDNDLNCIKNAEKMVNDLSPIAEDIIGRKLNVKINKTLFKIKEISNNSYIDKRVSSGDTVLYMTNALELKVYLPFCKNTETSNVIDIAHELGHAMMFATDGHKRIHTDGTTVFTPSYYSEYLHGKKVGPDRYAAEQGEKSWENRDDEILATFYGRQISKKFGVPDAAVFERYRGYGPQYLCQSGIRCSIGSR